MTIRTAKGMSSFDREDPDLEIHTCQQQLLRLDTLEQIESWYLSLCERIVAVRDRESQSKNNKTVEKMADYIQEHYTDPNLSADMLSQLIGLSASYVRKLFKEETGSPLPSILPSIGSRKRKSSCSAPIIRLKKSEKWSDSRIRVTFMSCLRSMSGCRRTITAGRINWKT